MNLSSVNIVSKASQSEKNNYQISYIGSDFHVNMNVDEIWDDGFTATIEIENTSNTTIKDWYLSFELPNDIINIWNAEKYKKEDNLYIIKNVSYNRNINHDEKICFGIECKGKPTTLPDYFGMLGKRIIIASDKYSIEYKITSDWEDRLVAEVSIINKTNKVMHNWELEAKYQNEIIQIWNATIEKHENDTYYIANNQYNSDIMNNGRVTFGIVVNKSSSIYFENCKLYESVCEEQKDSKNIYIDGQLNKDKDFLNIDIYSTTAEQDYEIYLAKELEEPKLIEKTNCEEYSINIERLTENLSCYVLQRLSGQIISSNVINLIFSNGEYTIEIIDTDKDKIPDYLESLYGTDSNNEDTDSDGLLDGDEIMFSYTNPLKSDTDDNGINDGDEDFDHDNLTNEVEISLKTNLFNADSDSDRLTDNEEIKKYHTIPTNLDSDGDGINDGDEITLDLNPLKMDSDGDGIIDSNEYIEQIIDNNNIDESVFKNNIATPTEIKLKARGNVNQNVDIGEYEGDLLEEEESSIVGKPIYIDNIDIETGSIGFAINSEYNISQQNFDGQYVTPLVICHHEMEEGNTEPIETEYNNTNRTLTATINSPGIYFIINIFDMFNEFDIDIEKNSNINQAKKAAKSSTIASQTVNGKADIVFLVDTTISMDYYINRVKANIKSFSKELSNAGVSASYALVEFRDITCDGKNSTKIKKNGNSNWYKSVTEFEQAIDKLEADGGGDIKETPIDALEKARRMKFRKNAQKFFVLVTDTDYKLDNNYGINSMEEMTNLLKEDEIIVSVIANKNNYKEYNMLFDKTGGVFANIDGDFKDYLLGIADRIGDEISNGYWIALDGLVPQVVRLDNKPTESGKEDTDNDNILDKDELQSLEPTKYISVTPYLKALKIKGGGTKNIPVYEYKSKPTVKDTDKDGIPDKYDAKPKKSFEKTYLTGKKRKTYQFLSGEDIYKNKIGKNYNIYGIDINKFMPKSKNVEKNIKDNTSHEQDVYKNRFCTMYKTESKRKTALNSILVRAELTQSASFVLKGCFLPMSYSLLSHYLGMKVEQKKYLFNVNMKGINDKMGTKVEFDANNIIRKTPSGTKRFTNMAHDMMRVCESTMKKNCILMFSTVDSISYCGYSPEFNYSISPYATANNFIDYDGFTSLNTADAGAVFRCSYDGESYYLTVNYYILDFYDFYEEEKPKYTDYKGVGLVSNDEYVVLSYYNKAAPFRVVGNYQETITWKKGKMYEAKYKKTYYYD